MPRAVDWPSLKDGLDRSLRIGLALAFLIAATIYFTARQSEIAASRSAAREAADTAMLEPKQAARDAAPGASPPPLPPQAGAPAQPAGRDVTPPSITALPSAPGTAPLTRLPPRAPLSPPEASKAEEKPEIRLRLLPRPIALDTGTFLVDRGKVRLSGVTPVAPSRECGNGDGAWPCGMQARTALRGWLRARSIRCDVPENFGKEPATIDAECSLGPQDIGLWLVENGWAQAEDGSRYSVVEQKAREEKRGIWGDGAGMGEMGTLDTGVIEPGTP